MATHMAIRLNAFKLTFQLRKAPRPKSPLRVQAVFRLVEHHRLRPVDHLVGDFLAAVGRQAVHEDGRRAWRTSSAAAFT